MSYLTRNSKTYPEIPRNIQKPMVFYPSKMVSDVVFPIIQFRDKVISWCGKPNTETQYWKVAKNYPKATCTWFMLGFTTLDCIYHYKSSLRSHIMLTRPMCFNEFSTLSAARGHRQASATGSCRAVLVVSRLCPGWAIFQESCPNRIMRVAYRPNKMTRKNAFFHQWVLGQLLPQSWCKKNIFMLATWVCQPSARETVPKLNLWWAPWNSTWHPNNKPCTFKVSGDKISGSRPYLVV